MKSETHILGKLGRCQRCGIELLQPMKDGQPVPVAVGDRIGIISFRMIPDAAYKITSSDDSNAPCVAAYYADLRG